MLVDCDIHVGYETLLDLAPYLDPATRELVVNCGTNGLGMPSYPWYHPTGWLRNDAFDRASTAVGSQLVGQTLDQVRAKVLDPLAVDHGILTPDEAAAFSIIPNGILGAHLSRAYNDWLLEHWLEREPRLRGLVVVPAQHPEAAAAEIRRVGERDEFVGVFLPGAARIPYGNPVHDPLWRACDELGLPVVVHTHFEGVGIAGPVTAAGLPDHYGEYHALCGSSLHGHFASILCHGILERFPRTGVMMMEGGLVGFVGLLWRLDTMWRACRSEMPWCVRPPSEYVFESRALQHAAARGAARRPPAGARAGGPAAVGHALLLERLPALGLRRAAPVAEPPARRLARRRRPPQREPLLRAAGPVAA